MTPQLQQAIKLLAASNLEIETFIGDALEANPLLEAGSLSQDRDGPDGDADDIPRDEFTADQLIAQGQGEGDAPLDLDPSSLDNDRDTGDGMSASDAEWGAPAGWRGARICPTLRKRVPGRFH